MIRPMRRSALEIASSAAAFLSSWTLAFTTPVNRSRSLSLGWPGYALSALRAAFSSTASKKALIACEVVISSSFAEGAPDCRKLIADLQSPLAAFATEASSPSLSESPSFPAILARCAFTTSGAGFRNSILLVTLESFFTSSDSGSLAAMTTGLSLFRTASLMKSMAP